MIRDGRRRFIRRGLKHGSVQAQRVAGWSPIPILRETSHAASTVAAALPFAPPFHAAFTSLLALLVTLASCSRPETTTNAVVDKQTAEQTLPTRPDPIGAVDGLAPVADSTDDWPVFRGNPRCNGVAGSVLPAELNVLWQLEVPRGGFESTPVIVDGVIYIGDVNGRLYSLHLANGETRWESHLGIGFTAAAAVRDGKIFIGDIDGVFHCLDVEGKPLWRYEAAAVIDAGANFHGDHVLFCSQDGTLYCLQAATGAIVWRYETNDQIQCAPTVVEDFAFVAGCDGYLHIVDLIGGSGVGQVDIRSPTGVTPAAAHDQVFFGTEQAGFFAVNWREKRVQWEFEEPAGATSFRSSPAAGNGVVVFGGRNRRVYGLSADDGSVIWSHTVGGQVDSSPVISGSHVYVAAMDGRLYTLSLADGQRISEIELGGRLIGSPAVSAGRLVIANDRGVVFCLGQ